MPGPDISNNQLTRLERAKTKVGLANAAWFAVKFPAAGAIFPFAAMLLKDAAGNTSSGASADPCNFSSPETYWVTATASFIATLVFAGLVTMFSGFVATSIRKNNLVGTDLHNLDDEEKKKFAMLVQPNAKQLAAVFIKTLITASIAFFGFGLAARGEECIIEQHPDTSNLGLFGMDVGVSGTTTLLYILLTNLAKMDIPRTHYIQVLVALTTALGTGSLAANLASHMNIDDPAVTAAFSDMIKFAFAGVAGAAAGLVTNIPPIRTLIETPVSDCGIALQNMFSSCSPNRRAGYRVLPNKDDHRGTAGIDTSNAGRASTYATLEAQTAPPPALKDPSQLGANITKEAEDSESTFVLEK
jgi:hypothetical protein